MPSPVEEPSQAERLGDVAVAGAGAEDKRGIGDRLSEEALNGSVEVPSTASDEVMEAKADAGSEEKPPVPPQAPERSKGKVALIMGSLMVGILRSKVQMRALLMEASDRCVSCCSRHCGSCIYHPLLFPLTPM